MRCSSVANWKRRMEALATVTKSTLPTRSSRCSTRFSTKRPPGTCIIYLSPLRVLMRYRVCLLETFEMTSTATGIWIRPHQRIRLECFKIFAKTAHGTVHLLSGFKSSRINFPECHLGNPTKCHLWILKI